MAAWKNASPSRSRRPKPLRCCKASTRPAGRLSCSPPATAASSTGTARRIWSPGSPACEAPGAASAPQLLRYDGLEAVRHLFIVTAGLDSQILGETEILGQVRRAYDTASAAGTTTRDMDLIFSAALAAGRRVRAETPLGRHPASVSSAAVELMADAVGRDRCSAQSSCSVPVRRRRECFGPSTNSARRGSRC